METQLVLFDYDALDQETRIVVQQRTGEIRDLVRNTAENVVRVGQKLFEVRERLHSRSGFQAWLRHEFDWSRRTAYNFISVYEQLGERANFAQMDIATSALYLLAAPSTPESARDEILERAEGGERITHGLAKEVVAEHRPPLQPSPEEGEGETTRSLFEEEAAPLPQDPPPEATRPSRPSPVIREPLPPEEGTVAPPQEAPAAEITLDFSTPVEAAPVVPVVVLTVRMIRERAGAVPDSVEVSIGEEEEILPTYYGSGTYDQLFELVERACESCFTEIEEVIIDE